MHWPDTEPERAARRLVAGGFAQHYDNALQVPTELPYDRWRELDPEDSLRFYALWLHDLGQLNSTPNKIIPRAPTGASSTSSSAS